MICIFHDWEPVGSSVTVWDYLPNMKLSDFSLTNFSSPKARNKICLKCGKVKDNIKRIEKQVDRYKEEQYIKEKRKEKAKELYK